MTDVPPVLLCVQVVVVIQTLSHQHMDSSGSEQRNAAEDLNYGKMSNIFLSIS